MNDNTNVLKRSRGMYVIEAAVEYMISILVAGSFLATLTKELGMSDSLTGILSSIISLGCLFQLLSIFYRRNKVKRFIIIMSVTNQLLFLSLYVIPLVEWNKKYRILIFVVTIVLAYVIYNLAHPHKINWLMSLVDDQQRGTFTANKEIVSLIVGMIFSFGMGAIVDYFAEKNQIKIAFALSTVVMFVLMILHTLSMIFAVERPREQGEKRKLTQSISDALHNKNVISVSIIFILYNIAHYSAVPFYGTYQVAELELSLKVVSGLVILSSVVRIAVSRFWGNYADKNSFARMIEKCLLILALGFFCVTMATPKNGLVMFALYYTCSGVAQGGINSALINLIFDYVTPDKRADSLAICQAISGGVGFLATLLVSQLVSLVQNNGNEVLGMTVYAQQIVSGLAGVFAILAVLFVRINMIKEKRR